MRRTTAEDVARELVALGADPTSSARSLLAQLRAAGVRAGNSAMWEGARAFRRRGPSSRPTVGGEVGKREAAALLGVSAQRVDQLRREGQLRSRLDPTTNRVWVNLTSVRALVRRREEARRAS